MKIGICGKSGSGKSTVAAYYVKKGFFLIDLDVVGKEVLEIYPEILQEIGKEFGGGYVEGGALNRQKLGALVFGDPAMLEKLNGIFFRYIRREVLKRMETSAEVVIDGAILFELGMDKYLDKTVYVYADREVAVTRLKQRENTDEVVLRKRIESQQKYDAYRELADISVDNSGSVDEVWRVLEDGGV